MWSACPFADSAICMVFSLAASDRSVALALAESAIWSALCLMSLPAFRTVFFSLSITFRFKM